MKYGRECVCGRGGECQGISAAFALLKDPRRGYVQLPQLTPEPTCYEEIDMNAMRASYLRHLRRTEQSLGDSQSGHCVALHHFHPTIVLKHSQMPDSISPIPKTLRKADVQFLKMKLDDSDRVRDETGRKHKKFYCVPNWTIDMAKEDLKHLIRTSRIYQEAKATSPLTPPPPVNKSIVVPVGSTPKGTPIAPRNLKGPLEAAASPRKLEGEQAAVANVEEITPTEEVVTDAVVPSPADEPTKAIVLTSALATSAAAATVLAASKTVEDEKEDVAPVESTIEGGNDVLLTESAAKEGKKEEVAAPGTEAVEEKKSGVVDGEPATLEGEKEEVAGTERAALGGVMAAAAVTKPTALEEEKMEAEETEAVALEEENHEVADTEPAGLVEEKVEVNETESATLEESKEIVLHTEPAVLEENKDLVEDTFELPSVPITKRIFDTVYNEEKLPSHFTMESEEGRQFLFRRMSKFEERRQEVCTPLVEEFVVRWTASLRVMQAGIFEMARAERLIRGAALANKVYAEAMQANFEDVYLDSEGNSVTEKRHQNRIAREREGVEYSFESAGGSPEKLKDAHTRSAVFGSLVNSQEVIAGKFLENYAGVNENVVSELASLRNHLKEEMIEFKRRGDPFIRDIQGSETEIQTTFAVFDIVGPSPVDYAGLCGSSHAKRGFFRRGSGSGTPMAAAGSYHGFLTSRSDHASPGSASSPDGKPSLSEQSSSLFRRGKRGESSHGNPGSSHGPGSNHGSPAVTSPTHEEYAPHLALDPALLNHVASPIASALRNNVIVRDGWLVEMLYRQAVNVQVRILQQCGAQLEEIWQSMHRIEVNRRIRLHEIMLDFMPRQRRLFLGLSPIPGPILNDLVQQRTDPQQLEEHLEDDVRKHMETLLKMDNSKRSHIMNRSRTNAPNFEELHGMLTGEFFDNGMLRAAKVAERKAGVLGNWKTTLVVVTGDNYLHMFDVSFIPEVAIGFPAEAVFDLLLPDFEIATVGADVIYKRGDSLLKRLTPVDTVDLDKCSSYISDDAFTMDIVESGVKGIIGFDATRKFTLRMNTPQEIQDWLTVVQSCQSGGGATLQCKSTDEQVLEEELVQRAVQSAEAHLARV